jgi:hypothetical protein
MHPATNPFVASKYRLNRKSQQYQFYRSAMQKLAKSFKPSELAHDCYRLYERFRPSIPEGVKGWGAKGDLDLRLIERLPKQTP